MRAAAAWPKDQVVYLDPAIWDLNAGGLRASQMVVDEVAAAYSRRP